MPSPHLPEIARTYARSSPAEQAAALGISRCWALKLRSQAIRAGLVSQTERGYNRAWSDKEHRRLVALIRDGLSIHAIARVLRRGTHGIYEHLAARDLSLDLLRAGQVWSYAQLCALFDVSWHVVGRWHRKEWIASRLNGGRNRAGGRSERLVTRAAILAFLTERQAWPSYEPERITDPDLRAAAVCERLMAGGAWVRASVWAARMGYVSSYASTLIATGRCPHPTTKIDGTWYVWSAL